MRKYILSGIVALSLLAALPVVAGGDCPCTKECQEKCEKKDSSTCECKVCDCKEGKCSHHKCEKK